MAYEWPAYDFALNHFAPSEFDYPYRMAPDFLRMLDELRERCGFPLRVTSDFRTGRQMADIYGEDARDWPNSPHLRGRAVDLKALPWTGENRLELLVQVCAMYKEGAWPNLGLETADQHFHVDDDTVLNRPHQWTGRSR